VVLWGVSQIEEQPRKSIESINPINPIDPPHHHLPIRLRLRLAFAFSLLV
jgi:hypothetical protein